MMKLILVWHLNKLLYYRKKEIKKSLKMGSSRGSYETKWSLLVRSNSGNKFSGGMGYFYYYQYLGKVLDFVATASLYLVYKLWYFFKIMLKRLNWNNMLKGFWDMCGNSRTWCLNFVPFSFDSNSMVLSFYHTTNPVIFGQLVAAEACIKLVKNILIKALDGLENRATNKKFWALVPRLQSRNMCDYSLTVTAH